MERVRGMLHTLPTAAQVAIRARLNEANRQHGETGAP
jgi:hypothetical protein